MSKKVGKKERREMGYFFLGMLTGLFFGLMTNIWVSSLFEMLRLVLEEPWELLSIVVILFISSSVVLIVFGRMFIRIIEKALPELIE